MTEILDAIEFELMGAVRRHNGRARRRRFAGFAAGGAAALTLAAGVGVATVTDTPLDSLFSSKAEQAQPADGVRSTVVVADGAGTSWSVIAYRTRRAFAATVLVRRPRTPGATAVAGVSGGLIALRRLDGGGLSAPVGDGFVRGGSVHAAVGGTVDASVRAVKVLLDGRAYPATLAGTVLRVPVTIDPAELNPSIDRSKLPREITLRAFGAALAPRSRSAPGSVTVTVELTRADGTVTREQAVVCLRERCSGFQAARPGRAG